MTDDVEGSVRAKLEACVAAATATRELADVHGGMTADAGMVVE